MRRRVGGRVEETGRGKKTGEGRRREGEEVTGRGGREREEKWRYLVFLSACLPLQKNQGEGESGGSLRGRGKRMNVFLGFVF